MVELQVQVSALQRKKNSRGILYRLIMFCRVCNDGIGFAWVYIMMRRGYQLIYQSNSCAESMKCNDYDVLYEKTKKKLFSW